MSENNTINNCNTPPSEETKSSVDEENPEIQLKYDDMANAMDQQKADIIARNNELIREAEEEEEKTEKKQKKAMDMKHPDFSLGWTIGDSRCNMVVLQTVVAGLCGVLLFMSYQQTTVDAENKCDESINKWQRPYLAVDGSVGCPWPDLNFIIRCIAPGLGLLFALITILLSYWIGSAILKDMKLNNDKREKVKKLEYFDLYNQYVFFKFMRFILGLAAYLQFISVGFDTFSFLVGNEFITSEIKTENDKKVFSWVIGFSLAVAIVLRISHDSMYQRVYKKKVHFTIGIKADKGYAGATVVDKEHVVEVVKMGDTHHLDPTQVELAATVQAQQKQILENQNRILASSTVVPSVYSDVAPSVYSQTQLNNHLNTQTMHSLTAQNLQFQQFQQQQQLQQQLQQQQMAQAMGMQNATAPTVSTQMTQSQF